MCPQYKEKDWESSYNDRNKRLKQCVEDCTLQDMKSSWAFYICNNKQGGTDWVYSRIDRVLVKFEWVMLLPDLKVYYRCEGMFDHCPAIAR